VKEEEPAAPNKELEEDVVVMIQEEEMVLVRKELQVQEAPVQEPQPKCIEPECTVSVPSKNKKKKQKRK